MPYAFGWWDSNTRKITINKDEPKWVQIRTLGHELVHAANDYSHWLEQNVVSPMQIEAGETVLALEEDDE